MYLLAEASDKHFTEPVITCSKLTIETLEKGVKCVQMYLYC